jgi:GrpB-like predicted nucleotidyltransferase (UPF0157 family)
VKFSPALIRFLAPFEILPFSETAAAVYGGIRSGLEKSGQIIGPYDLLILQQLLPAKEIVRISHIGSTAVKLIRAKPIVDILVETTPDSDWEAVKDKLLQGGYLCMLENSRQISFNKGYTENGFAEKVYHLHLRREGDNDELYFRDYLLDHLQAAKAYEELKLNLWKKYEHNRDAYTQSKTGFIRKYTQEARQLYGRRYDQNPIMERSNGIE